MLLCNLFISTVWEFKSWNFCKRPVGIESQLNELRFKKKSCHLDETRKRYGSLNQVMKSDRLHAWQSLLLLSLQATFTLFLVFCPHYVWDLAYISFYWSWMIKQKSFRMILTHMHDHFINNTHTKRWFLPYQASSWFIKRSKFRLDF